MALWLARGLRLKAPNVQGFGASAQTARTVGELLRMKKTPSNSNVNRPR